MTLSNKDLSHLIELADEATPGPWEVVSDLPLYAITRVDGNQCKDIVTSQNRRYAAPSPMHLGTLKENAHFISTANPTTVKAMAEELLAARAMRDKMMIENGIKWHNPDSTIIAGRIMARLLMNYDAIRANKNRDEGK